MDKLFSIIIFGVVLILSSCRANNSTDSCYDKIPGRWVVCDTEQKYSFWYPELIAMGDLMKKDVRVYTYDFAESCSTPLTGASYMKEMRGDRGKTMWGKVDAFDVPNPDFPPGTQPKCMPPLSHQERWGDDPQLGIVRLSNDAAYALCSEHEGKTVLICVSQVKDDPALAEEIFKTFRWTE